MNSKNRIVKGGGKVCRRFSKAKKGTRIVAMSLAVIMALSVFSANVSSIVNLLTAYAASGDVYYKADLTLYDYYTDNEIKGGTTDNNAYDGVNRNTIFNTALYDSGYSSKAADTTHTWSGGNLKYFPLYLGLQFPSNQDNSNFMKADDKYNYSMTANSEAGSTTSGAALNLVDSQLHNGVLTQGEGTVALPYFDEEFLTAPLNRVLSDNSISSLGISDYSSKTLGKVQSGLKFEFLKNSDGYYEYNSKNQGLKYTSGTFQVGTGTGYTKYDDIDNEGVKPGFFPWRYMGNSSQNFGYAAKFSIPFTMSNDGYLVQRDADGSTVQGDPIKFNFSGDDDVWVFIDDQLVLDVGGAHGEVIGSIDFSTKKATTNYVKSSTMYNRNSTASVAAGTTANGGVKDLTDVFNTLGLYNDATQNHTLTVYYIERGSLESNCRIEFNFQIADIISVENKVDTSNVNKLLLEQTEAAAAKEGIEYVIASNSKTSSLQSPDVNKQDQTITITNPLCTVSFDSGGYGSYDSYSVPSGTEVVLPNGYKLNRAGYKLKGWSLTSGGTTTVSSPYTVNTSTTFYAVWEKKPLAEVPEPLLMYVDTYSSISSGSYKDYFKTVVANDIYLANLTNFADTSGSLNSFWIQMPNNEQHPGDGNSSYSFTNNTTSANRNNNSVNLKAGGAYAFKIASSSSSALYEYSYATTSFPQITNTNAAAFVKNHFALYNKLVEAREILNTSDSAELLAAYNSALNYYKTVQYSSTAATDIAAEVTELGNAMSAVQYDHSYAYDSAKAKLYIYSTTQPSAVTVTNDYGLQATYEVRAATSADMPSGVSATNYYVVEVPTQIIDTRTPKGGGTASTVYIDTEITFTADGDTVSVKTKTAQASGTDYPCYYSDKDKWKDITAPDVSYSYSNNKILWFYGNPGAVTYTSADGADVNTVTATQDISGYYYVQVPQTVTKTEDSTSTTGNVNLSFNLNGSVSTTVATATSGRNAPCYFNTGVTGTTGWYNLLTVVVKAPGWWDTMNVWSNDGPLTCSSWTDDADSMTRIGTSSYYYYYLPSSSTKFIFLGDKNTAEVQGTAGNYSYQSLDVGFYALSGTYMDTLYDGATNTDPNQKISYPNTKYISETSSTTSDSTYYQYTATYKAATRFGTASYSLRATAIVPDETENETGTTSDDTAASQSEPTADESQTSQIQSTETTEDESQSDDTTQSTEDETTEEPAANSDDGTEDLAVSGNTNVGQFTNDGNQYAYAAATNFKLFDQYFSHVTGGVQEFLVRQTGTTDGKFNLMFDQTARFTYQFNRFSGIKISQTGTSYKFNTAAKQAGTTVLAGAATQKYSNAVTTNGALYNRYSTTWKITDEEEGVITSSRENYSAYPVTADTFSSDTNKSNIVAKSTNGSLYIDNINAAADTNTGIHLTATFTNEVLVGDLTITKELTPSALDAIQSYRAEHPDYDPEFAFQVSFDNIFGDTDSGSVVYHLADTDVGVYYINGTTKSTAYKTVGGVDNCISVKYSDLYNDDGTPKNYSIVIKGVPVQTDFTIKEVIVSEENKPSLELNSVTQAVLSVNTSLTPDDNNAVTSKITSQSSTVGVETMAIDLQSGPLAQYYTAKTNSTDFDVEFLNDVAGAYIILTKNINELYYGLEDNPAGLLGTGATVGGVTLTDDEKLYDPNGYETATEAEQTFIFKINEYNTSDTTAAPSKTFYEVISFSKASPIGQSRLSNSKLIKVDPTKYYTVEEISDWSWKYDWESTAVTANDTNSNAVSGKIATVHNLAEEATFDGITYERTDTVTFTNKKKTDNTEDVEGDTSIMINIIGKKAS